jgi:hypothetical protein
MWSNIRKTISSNQILECLDSHSGARVLIATDAMTRHLRALWARS